MKVEDILVSDPQAPLLYDISNAEGKRWLLPTKNMRVGFALYQPGGAKGHLLKQLFPLIHRVPFIPKLINAKLNSYSLNPVLFRLLCEVFDNKHLEWSIFCGTPGTRLKITIQLFADKIIKGYCKIGENKEIGELFKQEVENLDYLQKLKVQNVPKPLYFKETESLFIFIQDTHKSIKSKELHNINKYHLDFLHDLYEKTKVIVSFENTDLYKEIEYFESHKKDIEPSKLEIIEGGISQIISHLKDREDFYFFHGDFTPWNTYIENNQLYAFDFEYASRSFPPYLDLIHFVLQTEMLENNRPIENLKKKLDDLEVYSSLFNVRETIKIYLIHILLFYIRLNSDRIPSGDRCFPIWINLLKRYTTY